MQGQCGWWLSLFTLFTPVFSPFFTLSFSTSRRTTSVPSKGCAFKLLRQVEGLLMILIQAVHQRNHEERVNEDSVRHVSLH